MDTKEKVFEISIDLFLKKGCKAVTMDDIAHENGMSKKTLYELFKDKSELLEQTLMYKVQQMSVRADEMMKESGNIIEFVLRAYEKQSNMVISLKMEFFNDLKKYYFKIYNKVFYHSYEYQKKGFNEALACGQEQGLIIDNIDKNLVTDVMLEISNVFPALDMRYENYPKREIFKTVVIYYIRGISTQKGINIINDFLKKY